MTKIHFPLVILPICYQVTAEVGQAWLTACIDYVLFPSLFRALLWCRECEQFVMFYYFFH